MTSREDAARELRSVRKGDVMSSYEFHHTAIVVKDLRSMSAFYERLGFRQNEKWDAPDGSLSVQRLQLGSVTLELFWNREGTSPSNARDDLSLDLKVAGLRHIALSTPDLEGSLEDLKDSGVEIEIKITVGRTGQRYFCVRDPEDNWVEIVERV